jgi:hypothetical protein
MPFVKDPVKCQQNEAYLSICDASKGPNPVMKNKCFNDDFIQDFETDILQDDVEMQNIDLCKIQLLDALKTYKEGNTEKYGSQFKLFFKTSKPATMKIKTPSPMKIKTPSPMKIKTPSPMKIKTPSPITPSPVRESPVLPFAFRRMSRASPIEEDWRGHPQGRNDEYDYEPNDDRNYMRLGSPKDKVVVNKVVIKSPGLTKIAPPKIAVRMNKSANMRMAMINKIKQTIRKQILKGGKRRHPGRRTRKQKSKKTLKIHRQK